MFDSGSFSTTSFSPVSFDFGEIITPPTPPGSDGPWRLLSGKPIRPPRLRKLPPAVPAIAWPPGVTPPPAPEPAIAIVTAAPQDDEDLAWLRALGLIEARTPPRVIVTRHAPDDVQTIALALLLAEDD